MYVIWESVLLTLILKYFFTHSYTYMLICTNLQILNNNKKKSMQNLTMHQINMNNYY